MVSFYFVYKQDNGQGGGKVMAKRKVEWTQQKYEKFLKEKRGQGEGKNYLPWLNIQSFPSLGRISRIYSKKTGRIHHFLSDMQTNVFYIYSFMDNVIDIREHYPLLSINGVLGNLDKYGLSKYNNYNNQDKPPTIVTTTFLITTKSKDGEIAYIARSVKNSNELDRKYVIEMMELQRRYWDAKNIDWGIITQKEINKTRAKNIEWALSSLYDNANETVSLTTTIQEKLEYELLDRLKNFSSQPVRDICIELEKEYDLLAGEGILSFRRLVAKKKILIEMDKNIDLSKKSNKILIMPKEGGSYGKSIIS